MLPSNCHCYCKREADHKLICTTLAIRIANDLFLTFTAAVVLILISVLSAIGICERCKVQSGGVYFLIAHVLGSRRGAAVGIIYVLGQVRIFT